jgi:hypothetical protein
MGAIEENVCVQLATGFRRLPCTQYCHKNIGFAKHEFPQGAKLYNYGGSETRRVGLLSLSHLHQLAFPFLF